MKVNQRELYASELVHKYHRQVMLEEIAFDTEVVIQHLYMQGCHSLGHPIELQMVK